MVPGGIGQICKSISWPGARGGVVLSACKAKGAVVPSLVSSAAFEIAAGFLPLFFTVHVMTRLVVRKGSSLMEVTVKSAQEHNDTVVKRQATTTFTCRKQKFF
jgi:hypothetical protein